MSGPTTVAGAAARTWIADPDGIFGAVNDYDSGSSHNWGTAQSKFPLTGWPVTIVGWFRMDSPATAIPFAIGSSTSDNEWVEIRFGGGGVSQYAARGTGSSTTLVNHGTTISTNQWHHVAATYDGTDAAIWLNNSKVTNTPTAEAWLPNANRFTLGSGSDQTTPQNFFPGQIADARYYSITWTDALNDLAYSPLTRWDLYWKPGPAFFFMSEPEAAPGVPPLESWAQPAPPPDLNPVSIIPT